MSAPTLGMQFSFPSDHSFPVSDGDFSKILVVDTSEDASDTEFPIDTPKRFASGSPQALTALGTGLLRSHIQGINDQLSSLNKSADVTVVRIKKGADNAATSASIVNIINSLDTIPSTINATPGIVVAGSTAWRADLETANPVIAALEANLGKILAVAPVDVDPTTKEKAIDARETMTSGRLMPVGVAARVYEGETLVTRPMSSRVAGLMVRADNNHRGKPFDPICNEPVFGIVGVNRKISFNYLDGASEGQQMLAADVAIVAEGETGVHGAVGDGGFTFLGTDMAQTNAQWQQLHQVRGADYVVAQFIKITRKHLGKKLSVARVEAFIQDIAYELRDLKMHGHILGYAPSAEMFVPDLNSPEDLRKGILSLKIQQEQASAFKKANFEMRPYRPAVEGLISDIMNRLSAVV